MSPGKSLPSSSSSNLLLHLLLTACLGLVILASFLIFSLPAVASPSSLTTRPVQNMPPVEGSATPSPTCVGQWSLSTAANTGDTTELNGVAAVSPDDVWAVGDFMRPQDGTFRPLIEHWDGSQWTISYSHADQFAATLKDVFAFGSNDVWAVGETAQHNRTHVQHWDGTAWSVVQSANVPNAEFNTLSSVWGTSEDDLWAVGAWSPNADADWHTLVTHWDGTQWTIVPVPDLHDDNYLFGVSGVAADDVWAVGSWFIPGTGRQTLTLHWDGSVWTEIPSPNPGRGVGYLNSVAAIAPDNVWAVGQYGPASENGLSTLILHWDGSTWTQVLSPSPGSFWNNLTSVRAVSATDIWAAGFYWYENTSGLSRELLLHWDGSTWTEVPSANAGVNAELYGLSVLSPSEAWSVGRYQPNLQTNLRALAEHYSNPCVGPTGTPTSTRTPTPTRTGTPPTATTTPTFSPTPCGGSTPYSIATDTAQPLPTGIVDTGNHCDDCITEISLPFPFTLYDQTFTSARVDSNGILHLGNGDTVFHNTCLPAASSDYAIYPYWDDLATDVAGDGIFTALQGTAPNRVFVIEWRAHYLQRTDVANFSVLLYENSTLSHFDVVYGTLAHGSGSATVGVQRDADGYTEYECNGTQPLPPGLRLVFTRSSCTSAEPTHTATVTYTPQPAYSTTPALTPVMATASDTPQPSSTPVPASTTATATPPTPTTCTIEYPDVPPGSTFYQYVHCLACRGIISGYPDGSFGPSNPATRGQLSKIVSNSAGYTETFSTNTFEDVPVGSTFFPYVERLYFHGGIGGYACGNPEPCIPPTNKPYFRPAANVTRGQTSKIVAIACMLPPPNPGQQTFEDVAPNSTFWQWIEPLAATGAIGGYPCGGLGEPCVPPGNRPYFRPNADVTRGQSAKIVVNTFFPGCSPSSKPVR